MWFWAHLWALGNFTSALALTNSAYICWFLVPLRNGVAFVTIAPLVTTPYLLRYLMSTGLGVDL